MKRSGWLLPVVVGVSLALPALAAQKPPKPATKPGSAAPAPSSAPAAATTTSVTGPVKGAPTGKTFVIGRKGGPVTVDASKAKIRVNGKFADFDVIKGGVMVTAKGTMKGTTLMATDVDAHPRGSGDKKPAPGAAASGGGAAAGGAGAGAAGAPMKKK